MVSYANQQAASQRERVLEKQIKRFAKSYQRRLRKLVKTSSRLGDLLYSFPAVAFAIVSGLGDHNRRGEAVRLVKDGANLRKVAAALQLPYWTRHLPPEAFTVDLAHLPDGPDYNRRIVNLIPEDPNAAAMWLSWLQAAYAGCDDDFALWLASQKIYAARWQANPAATPVLPLATFAWFSSHGNGSARHLIQEPWHHKMGLGNAITNMVNWFDRVLLDLTRADTRRGPGRYSKRRKMNQYSLVPLVTARDLYEEGEKMNHCVATYTSAVAQGHCKIFSVQRYGRRIATLEIRWSHGQCAQPIINQLLGHSNAAVDSDVYLAVGDWLKQNQGMVSTPNAARFSQNLDETRWRSFWAAYIAEKGAGAGVATRPDGNLVAKLCRDIDALKLLPQRRIV
ncbi:MAG: PcfJ domain-containing protein [Pseudomonadota bacterium]